MWPHQVRVAIAGLGKPGGRILQFLKELDCAGPTFAAAGSEHVFNLLESQTKALLTLITKSTVEHGDGRGEILRAR